MSGDLLLLLTSKIECGELQAYGAITLHHDPPAPVRPQAGCACGDAPPRWRDQLAADQTLLGMIHLKQELEDLLVCPVDVTEAGTLHPLIRSKILGQALPL